MPAEYRDPRTFEVAEYDYAQKRITVSVSFDNLEDALTSWMQMILANDMPPDSADNIKDALHTELLGGATIFDTECLSTNRRVSLIIRK